MSGSPCCPITPFQVALSMPTCALKLPKRTRDSDEVAVPNATSASSRKVSYCDSTSGAYTCKIHRDRSCSLSFGRQTLPPSGIPSQRHTQLCWGSQVSQHQLEQTSLHQHQSKKLSTHRSTQQFQNPGALLMKFPQHQGDTVGLRKQAPALFRSVTKRSSSQKLDPGSLVQLEYIFCALPPLPPQTLSDCVGGFTMTVSLLGRL